MILRCGTLPIITVVFAAACGGDHNTDTEDASGGNGQNSTDGDSGNSNEEPITIDDVLYNEETQTVSEWITPEWYTCETEESACGLPCPANDLWVAINETDFRGSRICSACMRVTGPLGEVVVDVIENCGGACVDGEIELSRSAFEAIGILDEGRADVAWQLVPCDRDGPISFAYERESDEWWAGIQVRNPALPVASLSIRYNGGDFERLEMDGWNHFPVSGDLGEGPFDFRVTAIDGQVLLEEGIPYQPGGVVQANGQFRTIASTHR